MGDYGMRGLGEALKAIAWLLAIFIPLGMWKLVEIAIWLYQNVSVSVGVG